MIYHNILVMHGLSFFFFLNQPVCIRVCIRYLLVHTHFTYILPLQSSNADYELKFKNTYNTVETLEDLKINIHFYTVHYNAVMPLFTCSIIKKLILV